MVKKLFKHEINAYLRVMLPVYICLGGVALLGRLIQLFEADTTIYALVNGSSIFVYVISILVCFGFSTFFSVVRFYKNLFTGEGYLTFTLPVTPTQHLLVKLLTSILFNFISTIAVWISFMIFTVGDVLNEVTKAFTYLCGKAVQTFAFDEWLHLSLYLLEFLVCIFLGACSGVLLYYVCIAIGQLSRKNRALCAVGVYFGYYFITQIIGTVLGVLLTVFATSPVMEKIGEFIEAHTTSFIHILLCSVIIIEVVISFVFFHITRKIMTKKLNLE
ncbi:MAG: hypothetical protein E7551_02310 [Ruminococcaceae bacterium]|nr:hypothetical protein [Oscillospiraceae bacterium]